MDLSTPGVPGCTDGGINGGVLAEVEESIDASAALTVDGLLVRSAIVCCVAGGRCGGKTFTPGLIATALLDEESGVELTRHDLVVGICSVEEEVSCTEPP